MNIAFYEFNNGDRLEIKYFSEVLRPLTGEERLLNPFQFTQTKRNGVSETCYCSSLKRSQIQLLGAMSKLRERFADLSISKSHVSPKVTYPGQFYQAITFVMRGHSLNSDSEKYSCACAKYTESRFRGVFCDVCKSTVKLVQPDFVV